jgi:replicative DNA helicase
MSEEKIFGSLTAEDAEGATLGAILLKPSIVGWLDLDEHHFQVPLHIHVFRAIRKLHEADTPIDEITLFNALEDCPGGPAALSSLMVRSPTADNAEYWVAILEGYRRKRVLSDVVSKATNDLRGGEGEADEIQDSMLSGLAAITASGKTGAVTMEEASDDELARMEAQWDGGESPRMPTGIVRLDAEIEGFPIGTTSALGARPGVGKSTTLWNFCRNACARGEHAIVLTNEDRPHVAARIGIAHHAGIERRRLISGNLTAEEKDLVRFAVEETRDVNSRYHTVRVHGRKMRDICREATGLIRRYGAKLVALDYIQNVPNPELGMTRNYGIEENMSVFEAPVADEDIVGIVVGQLKRIDEARRPIMSDFKDSGSIEQKCKLMMTLSDSEESANILEVDIVKNSEGVQNFMVPLAAEKGFVRLF